MKNIAILGCTGSIGIQAADVIRSNSDKLHAGLLAARSNARQLARLANELRPETLILAEPSGERELRSLLSYAPRVLAGEGAAEAALQTEKPDQVLLSVSGMSGLPLFASCLRQQIPVALANKEAVVAGGDLIRNLWDASGVEVLPVDSEHCAIFQCLGDSYDTGNVERIWLTASGGPFRGLSTEELREVCPEAALKHPTWDMSPKISVDSATLANKGLEVIEAHYLYRVQPDRIEVVVQPQSLVHSMVEFKDRSVLAQIAEPDMRLPIRRALLGPSAAGPDSPPALDFRTVGSITFEAPDSRTFECLPLAYQALEENLTAVYNAADEEAVALFLQHEIPFTDIPRLIRKALKRFRGASSSSVQGILELDAEVREAVRATAR